MWASVVTNCGIKILRCRSLLLPRVLITPIPLPISPSLLSMDRSNTTSSSSFAHSSKRLITLLHHLWKWLKFEGNLTWFFSFFFFYLCSVFRILVTRLQMSVYWFCSLFLFFWLVVEEEEVWIWGMIEKEREAVVEEAVALVKIKLTLLVDSCKHISSVGILFGCHLSYITC